MKLCGAMDGGAKRTRTYPQRVSATRPSGGSAVLQCLGTVFNNKQRTTP